MVKGQLKITTIVEYNGATISVTEEENCGNPAFVARSVRIITDRLRTQLSDLLTGRYGDVDAIRKKTQDG